MLAEIQAARATPGAWAPTVRALLGPTEVAASALEAAKSAGAVYADVRFSYDQAESLFPFVGPTYPGPRRTEHIGWGVRALVNGYWGFAGLDGVATTDDAATLGRAATAQATNAARGKPRTVDLGRIPVATGTWATPVEIDPFTVSYEEKADYMDSIIDDIQRRRYGVAHTFAYITVERGDRLFASSEGSSISQTIFTTTSRLEVNVSADWMSELDGQRAASFLSSAGAGWEYILSSPLRERATQLIDEALGARRPQPVDLGRYDVVFDAEATAQVIAASIGDATALDRAMGYRANEDGTSYLRDPLSMLGTFHVGSPLLTVSMNRSMPHGVATVKWDDEGVEPRDATLVKEGILTDFQTTREAASWLAPYYGTTHQPVRSNGCMGLVDRGASEPPVQVPPNLVMQPGADELSFHDLVKSTKKGLAFVGGQSSTDWQALNGVGGGSMVYRITNGELDGTVGPAQYLYRSPDFWKNLVAIGGKRSAAPFGLLTGNTVSAVPMKVTNVAITDPTRKA
jgi:TldD protein